VRFGFPIRTSPDQRSFASFPGLIAGCRVLRRLSMPRHPPYTLKSLATFTASPSTSGPPLHPTRKTRRTGRDKSGPARAWRGRTMLPAIRMSRSRPSRGTSQDTRTTGRPVMGQLSPKKVLDDARPTESTNLERPSRGNGCQLPGVGITPDAGAGVADPAERHRPSLAAPSLGGPLGNVPLGLLP
jgi:hypothetical protein